MNDADGGLRMKRRILCGLLFLLLVPAWSESGVIQLPQTGQTSCWDDAGNVIDCTGTGQDGEGRAGVPWPVPRFTVQGDCVTDNLTGLMWSRNAAIADLQPWAAGLDLCGFNDWRLPNVNELESLVNVQQPNTAYWLNGQGFVSVQEDMDYVSSSIYGPVGDYVFSWCVNMTYGAVYACVNGYNWPVRAGQ